MARLACLIMGIPPNLLGHQFTEGRGFVKDGL
jgi:hypothetical protein